MNYKFEVTQEEAQIIAQGLAELPIKIAMSLLNKLQKQAVEQDKTAETQSSVTK